MYLSAFIPGSTWMQSVRGVYVCVYLCACMKKYVVPIILRFYSMQKKLNGEKVRKKNRRKKKKNEIKWLENYICWLPAQLPLCSCGISGRWDQDSQRMQKIPQKILHAHSGEAKAQVKPKGFTKLFQKLTTIFCFCSPNFFFCAFRLWIRS